MAINSTKLIQQVANTIQSMGSRVSIYSVANAKTINTYAVFAQSVKKSETTDQTALFTELTIGETTAYVAAISPEPQPGDTFTGTGRSYGVITVEKYQPGDVVLAFKLALQ
jgi:hypothetical protein